MKDLDRLLHRWLVEAPARFLDNLSFRKVLFTIGMMLILIAIAQMLPLDMAAFLFASDAMTYFELIAIGMLIAAGGRMRVVAALTKHKAREAAWALVRTYYYARSGGRQNGQRVGRKPLPRPSDDEDGAAWAGMAYA